MKTKLYILISLLCSASLTFAQVTSKVYGTIQTFPGGHLRVHSNPMTLAAHIITPRNSLGTSSVHFYDEAYAVGGDDKSYVNGYVTRIGDIGVTFEFPVGSQDGDDFRPLRIVQPKTPLQVAVAYWTGDVSKNVDPTGGPHDRNAISSAGTDGVDKIVAVSDQGFWDWVAQSESGATPVQVSIADHSGVSGFDASAIRLVGWNINTNQWENLSGIDAPASNTEGTLVTGVLQDITLYSAITIGSIDETALPVKLLSLMPLGNPVRLI